MFTIRLSGRWKPEQVQAAWTSDGRRREPAVDALIEQTWRELTARPGIKLFDGPMCRLESVGQDGDVLRLALSRTSYRVFAGTNLHHAELAEQYGPAVLANPIGLSSALQSSDGWLLLGRRNAAVAYHPNRVHPFAGAMEPADPPDVFAQMRRELEEELSLRPDELGAIHLIGLVEDDRLRQPELVFDVPCLLTRRQIEARLDESEHAGVLAIAADSAAVAAALNDPLLTPVAAGTLSLWRERYTRGPGSADVSSA